MAPICAGVLHILMKGAKSVRTIALSATYAQRLPRARPELAE